MMAYQWKLAPVVRRATQDPGLAARPKNKLEAARADLQDLRRDLPRDQTAEAIAEALIRRLEAQQGRRHG